MPCTNFAIVAIAVAALRETAVPLRGDGPRRSRSRRRLVGAAVAGFLLPVIHAAEDRLAELIDVQRLAEKLPHVSEIGIVAVVANGRGGDDDRPRQQVG